MHEWPTKVDRNLVDEIARRRTVALAGHGGDVATVRHHRDDQDPGVRATVLGALHRLDDLGADDLLRGLADPSPVVRRRAAELAATRPGDEDGLSLVPALADDDASVVEMAAWACGERTPPEASIVAALSLVATDHDDPLCREAAVAALGALGQDAGLPAILAATTDRPAVRRRAILALAPFAGADVDAALSRALEDRDWQVRQAAQDLTGSPDATT
jgi:HEAT repeat protein